MKKYNKNWKVEFCLDSNPKSDYRGVFWRVLPSELSVFRRLFLNDWSKVYRAYKWLEGKSYLYSIEDYYKEIVPLKTIGDLFEYLDKQDVIIQEIHDKKVKEHEIWPDSKYE